MSKRYFFYKILLHLLQGLVYAKRLVFWLGKLSWKPLSALYGVYHKTIGFHVYKAFFYTNKFVRKHMLVHKYSKFEVLGQRGALQIGLLLIAFCIMFPQSKLYTKEYTHVPGRGTLLFKLIGPGDTDVEFEEVSGVEIADAALIENAASWREGAVIAHQNQGVDISSEEFAGVSILGSAVSKPIISPTASVPSLAAGVDQSAKRSGVIEYVVQPGDVIGNIAQAYGISVETILVANNLTARSYIRPGDKLKILPVDGVTYTIAKGDTIQRIAQRYGAKAEDIIAFNKLENNGGNITIGEELILPGGRRTTPVTTVVVRSNTQQSPSLSKIVAPPPSVSAPAGSGYLWPSGARIITQYYGLRHTGLDIAGAIGTPIYAARGGVVVTSQCGWNGGYGCYIVIDHGNGVQTLYAHHSKLFAVKGQTVTQGETIALMGSTGRSTGPHVHFEVRLGGSRANPLQYVRR